MITEHKLAQVTWIDVHEPQDKDIERLTLEFKMPPLLIQDCLKPEHLPKYEATDEGHFLMVRCFDSKSRPDSISVQSLTRKVAIYITEGRIVTIHRARLEVLEKITAKNNLPSTLEGLLHHILIALIHTFDEPIQKLQDSYDDFESDILSKKCESLSTKKIYRFRRRMFVIKRMLKQTNDAIYHSKELWTRKRTLQQDVKENIDQLYYTLDEISDNFEHLYQLFISITDQRANEVMKILTVFSSIMLPLNFIASFYGMNFQFLPGLESPHAFGLIVSCMALISIGAIWYFKRRGWFVIPRE